MVNKLTQKFREDKPLVAKKGSLRVEKIVKLLESYAGCLRDLNRSGHGGDSWRRENDSFPLTLGRSEKERHFRRKVKVREAFRVAKLSAWVCPDFLVRPHYFGCVPKR